MIYNAYKNQPKISILKYTNPHTYTTAKGGNFIGWGFSSTFELKEKINMC